MSYVLDTHILIWYFIGSKRLGKAAKTARLKTIAEIHDRIIVATAKFYSADIITKDKIIKNSGEISPSNSI